MIRAWSAGVDQGLHKILKVRFDGSNAAGRKSYKIDIGELGITPAIELSEAAECRQPRAGNDYADGVGFGSLEKIHNVCHIRRIKPPGGIADRALAAALHSYGDDVVSAGLHAGQRGFRAVGIVEADDECGVSEDQISSIVGQIGQADVIVAARNEHISRVTVEKLSNRRGRTYANRVWRKHRKSR